MDLWYHYYYQEYLYENFDWLYHRFLYPHIELCHGLQLRHLNQECHFWTSMLKITSLQNQWTWTCSQCILVLHASGFFRKFFQPTLFSYLYFVTFSWNKNHTLDCNMESWSLMKPGPDNTHCLLCQCPSDEYGRAFRYLQNHVIDLEKKTSFAIWG